MTNLPIKPGIIINLRKRLWRVDEYNGTEIVATPITGAPEDKRTFLADIEEISEKRFEPVNPSLPGDFSAQNLLLRAYRFDLIHGSAPFLSLHRSSVVPYNYQMVPLVLALEKPECWILIGDDVGLGKTIEAGLIISELLQRGKIKRVLFLTPASLKQQWKEALEYFFHIRATIIDAFTRKEFEKELPAGANPWQYFRFVIASVDYAKAPDIKQQLSEQQWDMLLVDEIHLCACPHSTVNSSKQQKRYELVRDLGRKINNVLFLTATPHNGFSDSFASILEMINPEIVRRQNGSISFDKAKARFNVVQRNRKKLEDWYRKQGKKSPFPQRDQREIIISPDPKGKLLMLLEDVERYGDYILLSARQSGSKKISNIASWVAFHFQKRCISSPWALLKSLENRISCLEKQSESSSETDPETLESYIHEFGFDDERSSEESVSMKLDFSALVASEISEIRKLAAFAASISPKDDEKLQKLRKEIIPELFEKDPKIILFTKYRDTLDYLEKNLKSKDYDVFTMHGDLSLKSRIDIFSKFDRSKKAILIATDVISEGLNLQRLSSNIVHYELPWNPNRLEQRNGRIDRIGQKKEIVNIRTLVIDKSLDKEILDLLIHKKETIKLDRDYAAAYFGDEEYLKTIIDEAAARRRTRKKVTRIDGPDLFSSAGVDETRKSIRNSFGSLEEDMKRKKKIEEETFYSSLDIELPEIDRRIEETKKLVGSQEEVFSFVRSSLSRFHSALIDSGGGFWEIQLRDARLITRKYGDVIKNVTFDPETALNHPEAVILDAGHPVVRKLIDLVKAEFFSEGAIYGRNAYFFSSETDTVTYLYCFLVRFTVGIREKRVIEELIPLSINSFSGEVIEKTDFLPAQTTRTLDRADLQEYITDALNFQSLGSIIRKKINDRRIMLISERQELYKKILVDSRNTSQPAWLDDIIHIEDAGYDLLSVTVILPE